MKRVEIHPYEPCMAEEWDSIVRRSNNGTFLHLRNYMDYHADRFTDRSFVLLRNGKMVAVIPGAEIGNIFISHPGLTYGGLVHGSDVCGADVLHIFESLCRELKGMGVEKMIYKPVPHIYHTVPCEEDLYALFRMGAVLFSRSLSSAFHPSDGLSSLRRIRRCGVKKGERAGLEVSESKEYTRFWKILATNLSERHSVNPVHTVDEIEMLAHRFPSNIRLHEAELKGEAVAGLVTYSTATVLHAQYMASSPEGRRVGALDFLISRVMESEVGDRYLDFGISCESGGEILNEGLLYQKEGFGARGICYDAYELTF